MAFVKKKNGAEKMEPPKKLYSTTKTHTKNLISQHEIFKSTIDCILMYSSVASVHTFRMSYVLLRQI